MGNYGVSYDSNGNQRIPESETQAFLDAVANGLLCIEQERKNRYQRIDEAEKAAFVRGEVKGKEDKLTATVRELEEKQALMEEQERKARHEVDILTRRSTRTEWVRFGHGGW